MVIKQVFSLTGYLVAGPGIEPGFPSVDGVLSCELMGINF